ncbi:MULTISPECIES: hypothetical protein [Streptomyces]|uniref:hypothetical protein n=1 Tax=Streptomyces TaxID=1883 RepID=UPI001C469BCA|nr:hypothetical protein [Streptomyces sp. MW-W600-10]MBV7248025.1 hypothetical protein [Streptomyces sp. MW-W600-10]
MTQNVMEAGKPRRMFAAGYEAVRSVSFPAARGRLPALLGTDRAGGSSTAELRQELRAR